jgi:DNA polymerase IV
VETVRQFPRFPPRSEATILHADLDAFYASVEQRDNPRLRGRPVAVGAGVVLSASYEARAFGVRTPMGLTQARKLCPQLIVVGPRFAAYSDASKAVFEIFEETTPLVEGLSIDEAFLDVRGMQLLAGSPKDIAVRLKCEIRERVGLPISIGVARTKFLAKVASDVAKPDGLLVVPPDAELAFLHPLGVERLWGVGMVTARKLRAQGISTVADVARQSEATLISIVGRAAGRHLHALSSNVDPRPVHVGRRRHSIGSQRALGRRSRTIQEIDVIMVGLVDGVCRRLRTARRVCRTVVLRLRFNDFSRATRSHTLVQATAETQTVLAAARGLLSSARPMIANEGLTLVGVALANLEDDSAIQLALPFDRHAASAIDAAIDSVRKRFGTTAITRAVLLGRDQGLSVPLLPD